MKTRLKLVHKWNFLYPFLACLIGFTLTISTAYAQTYCTPSFSSSADYIKDVITTGGTTNLNNTGTTQGANGYSDYTAQQFVITQGATVGFTVNLGGIVADYLSIWIDLNGDGTFATTENIFASTARLLTFSVQNIYTGTIPPDTYRMRVMAHFSLTTNPCVSTSYGEAEDYTLVVNAPPPCSGMPDVSGITVTPTPSTANAGDPYNVTATGFPIASNLTYTWVKSTDGGTTWAVEGTPGPIYSPLTGQVAPPNVGDKVQYRLMVACASDVDTSAHGEFTTQLLYCTPSFVGTTYGYIKDFSTSEAVVNITNNGSGQSVGGYGNYTATDTVKVTTNSSFDFSIAIETTIGSGVAIWVDWDNNGTFAPTERVFNTTATVLTTTGTINTSGHPAGTYRMRIMADYSLGNPVDPCKVTTSGGEAEDYTLVVITPTPCSGTPDVSGITVTVTPSTANAGDPYNVTANGFPFDDNLIYSWVKSTDNGVTWTTEGTPGPIYAPLTGQIAPPNIGDKVQYRLAVACGSDVDTSAHGEFTTQLVYCTPSFLNSTFGYIKDFSTSQAVVNITNNGSGHSGGYADYTATDTVKVTTNSSFDFSIAIETTIGSGVAIWIDWDGNGTFDPTERVFNTTAKVLATTGTINTSGHPAGTYRMRVMSDYSTGTPANPCILSTDWGEAEDYILDIFTPAPCSGTPSAGTITVNPSVANAGDTYGVTATGYSNVTGLTYTWIKSTDNEVTWAIEGTPGSFYTPLTGQIAPPNVGDQVHYALVATCGTDSDTSAVKVFTTQIVHCTPNFQASLNGYINTFSTTGAIANITNNTNAQSPGGYGDFTASHIIQAAPNTTVNFSAAFATTVGSGFAIWVDWDQNGTFAPSERMFNTTALVTTATGSFTISGASGTYRMRIMADYSLGNPVDPCKVTTGGGEAEDYTLVVITPTPCSGTPDVSGIVVTVSPTVGNAGDLYNVTATGIPYDGNLIYSWIKSTDNGVTWTTEGTPGSIYTPLTGQIAPPNVGDEVRYALVVTCGTDSDTSEVKVFTTQLIPCIPSYSSTGDYTASFSTSGTPTPINNINYTASSQTGTLGYNDLFGHPTNKITQIAGGTISFTHTYGGAITNTIRMWVDWNNNGTFEDSEEVHAASYSSTVTQTGSFDIPMSTPSGDYRMRLRSRWSNYVNDITACNAYTFGQALDFTLTVIGCAADAGTVADKSVCLSSNVTLTSSATNGTWVWSSNDPTIAVVDATSGVVTGLQAGSAEIVYAFTDSLGCVDSTSATVTVVAPYTVSITNAPDTLYVGDTHTYTSSGTSGTWSSSNAGVAEIDENTGVLTAISKGSVNITYVETSVCVIADIKPLVVDTVVSSTPPPPPPGNGGGNTGVKDIDFVSNISLFPNPANTQVNIEFTLQNATDMTIEVVDMNGKTIETIVMNNAVVGTNATKLNVVNFANGVYSVVLRSNDSLTTKKLVISK